MIKEVSKSESRSDVLSEILIFVLTILISTFILRLVWNRSLVKHISILKPIKNLTDALILAISMSVIRGI
ncbi:hypothetical protein MPWG_00104 [Micromonas pusilla virus PL1]|jgi:hypothetical protein|nr:hypothetical protein MPWG_00104 [Micromonas pusilla virus PL1]|tara:strand:+ start:591 stop:800 length:210 start_codon:yes stop_codon:yes gene_type:complete